MSCVEASENSPVAVNPFCDPIGIVAPDGVTVIDEMVASLTVRFTVTVAVPSVAVIMVVPGPRPVRGWPVAIPVPPIVATVVSEEDHAA